MLNARELPSYGMTSESLTNVVGTRHLTLQGWLLVFVVEFIVVKREVFRDVSAQEDTKRAGIASLG